MSSVPSIKGSVMGGIVERVVKLLAEGTLARDELDRWLEADDVALLEQPIVPASWYDIRAYDRVNVLLVESEGHGSPDYFRRQGYETAQRLKESGIYGQIEYLERAEVLRHDDPDDRFRAFGRDLRLLASLSNSILSFTRWTARVDPERERRYVMEVSEAADMPESLCWRSEGFMNGMSKLHGIEDLWRWERARRDRVLFRMLRSP